MNDPASMYEYGTPRTFINNDGEKLVAYKMKRKDGHGFISTVIVPERRLKLSGKEE